MTISFHNAPLVTETIRTTDAAATELLRWTPELDSASIVRLVVNGTATSGDVVSVVRTWSVKRSAAGTIVAALSAEKRKDSGSGTWVVDVVVDGGDSISAVAMVTGEAGHDVTWTGVAVALNGSREIVLFLNEYSTRFNDGVTDESVTLGDVYDVTYTREPVAPTASWSLWFKTTTASDAVLIGKRAGAAAANWGWDLKVMAGGTVRFSMYDDTNVERYYATTATYNDGQWHHCVLRWRTRSLYIDGAERKTGDGLGIAGATNGGNAVDLRFGSRDDGSAPYDGWLDEVAVYDREIDVDEIAWLYNGGAPRDPRKVGAPAGLAHYWRMGDETDAHPTIVDRVGAYDGTMVNMAAGNFETDVPS